ncbi:MAG: DUF1552 domain-containing protein [Isosphaeraceae bacterium]
MTTPLSRRTVLRGLGTAMALPWLEAMAPRRLLAAASSAAGDPAAPLRMGFFYVPNGVHMPHWTPENDFCLCDLPPILKSLEPYREKMLVLTGLAQDNAFAKGDGPGDHARSLAAFLTGAHPKKTDGANIRNGVSVDQVAAQKVGDRTRLPSLELGLERGAQAGNCDSGYSCAYSSNISWRSETMPMAKEINPRAAFDRLFASDASEGASKAARYKASILDYVLEDAAKLKTRVGQADNRKLDEYFSAVREIERRMALVEKGGDKGAEGIDYPRPTGVPKDYQEHARLMLDMLALAYQSDATRISTFMFANEGSNRPYPNIGVTDGHHDLSHHSNDRKKQEKISQINTFHMEQFSYLVAKLAAMPEGDGTVLDHSMLVYGSGIGDGNRHNHNDLPVLMVGGANGTIATGRHLRYPKNTPLNNLYLNMLDRMGVTIDSLGDSNGRLDRLEG